VDPAVIRSGRLTQKQVDAIREQARRQDAQLRIWVLPATRLGDGSGPAYRPQKTIARLHRLVGKPGTYALLTAAPTQAAGQSFFAFQWPGPGPVYQTGKAARDAIACCAPDYAGILHRFVDESHVPRERGQQGPSGPSGRHHRHHAFVPDV